MSSYKEVHVLGRIMSSYKEVHVLERIMSSYKEVHMLERIILGTFENGGEVEKARWNLLVRGTSYIYGHAPQGMLGGYRGDANTDIVQHNGFHRKLHTPYMYITYCIALNFQCSYFSRTAQLIFFLILISLLVSFPGQNFQA